jgi:hypothetical protein
MTARGRIELATAWHKASASNGTTGNCVEVALAVSGEIAVRNSRDPEGPWLLFTRAEWAAFSSGMSGGEFSFLLDSAHG